MNQRKRVVLAAFLSALANDGETLYNEFIAQAIASVMIHVQYPVHLLADIINRVCEKNISEGIWPEFLPGSVSNDARWDAAVDYFTQMLDGQIELPDRVESIEIRPVDAGVDPFSWKIEYWQDEPTITAMEDHCQVESWLNLAPFMIKRHGWEFAIATHIRSGGELYITREIAEFILAAEEANEKWPFPNQDPPVPNVVFQMLEDNATTNADLFFGRKRGN